MTHSHLPNCMKQWIIHSVCMVACLWCAATALSAPLPEAKPVHIEVKCDPKAAGLTSNRHMEFWLTDLYTGEEKRIRSEYVGNGTDVLDFQLYHPLYDVLNRTSARPVPFYVEPGDSLVIHLGTGGKVLGYEHANGQPVKYEQLLRHDISYQDFYTDDDFKNDGQGSFVQFADSVLHKMQTTMQLIDEVAARYRFSDQERQLARCNAQLQYALWIFEFGPLTSTRLTDYSRQHNHGWQSLPQQEADMAAICDTSNYGFLRQLPLNDSTCLASRLLPQFIQSYEHAEVLTCDLYQYYGSSPADLARTDSAFVAKELAITQCDHPSLFMDIALKRKHAKPVKTEPAPPIVDDGSILLEGVEVAASSLEQFYEKFGRSEYDPKEVVKKIWAPHVGENGPISLLVNLRRIKSHKRAEKLVKQLGLDDEEREAVMRAYEKTVKR